MPKSEHWGTDWQGKEILTGDSIVHDPQLDEVVMKKDLVEYPKEKYGFEFMEAE